MSQPTLFFSDKCPDTQPFVAGLEARGIRYDAVNITNSMRELKAFLLTQIGRASCRERV